MEMNNEKSEVDRIFRYFICGWVLSFIDIQIGVISGITSLLSGLLFYLAARMLRDINSTFKKAYYLFLVFLIVNMFNIVLLSTPYEFGILEIVVKIIGIISRLLIIIGFYNFLEDKKHIKKVLVFYLINLWIAVFASLLNVNTSVLLVIIVIIFFVLMLHHFKMTKMTFMEMDNFKLDNIKIASKMILAISYLLGTITLCIIMTFISITTYYQYDSNKDEIKFNLDEALDYKKTISYDEKGEKFAKIEAYLFKDDNKYRNYIIVSDLKDSIYYQELDVRLVNKEICDDYNYDIAYQNPSNNKIYQTTSSLIHQDNLYISENVKIYGTYFGRNNPKECIILVEYNVLNKNNPGAQIYVNMDNEIIPSYPFKNKHFDNNNFFWITVNDDKLEIS